VVDVVLGEVDDEFVGETAGGSEVGVGEEVEDEEGRVGCGGEGVFDFDLGRTEVGDGERGEGRSGVGVEVEEALGKGERGCRQIVGLVTLLPPIRHCMAVGNESHSNLACISIKGILLM
jgi:hypothetical protein